MIIDDSLSSSLLHSILKRAGGFSEVTSGRVLSFPDVSVGETAAPSLSRRMRRG